MIKGVDVSPRWQAGIDFEALRGQGYEFAMGLLPKHPKRLSETKITVHFVDTGVDTGPIVKQVPVPISPDDTIDSLRERGLKVEHQVVHQVGWEE